MSFVYHRKRNYAHAISPVRTGCFSLRCILSRSSWTAFYRTHKPMLHLLFAGRQGSRRQPSLFSARTHVKCTFAVHLCGPNFIPVTSHCGSLPNFGLISPIAGEVWYAVGLFDGIMLFGLAVFFFVFSLLPYWFKSKCVMWFMTYHHSLIALQEGSSSNSCLCVFRSFDDCSCSGFVRLHIAIRLGSYIPQWYVHLLVYSHLTIIPTSLLSVGWIITVKVF